VRLPNVGDIDGATDDVGGGWLCCEIAADVRSPADKAVVLEDETLVRRGLLDVATWDDKSTACLGLSDAGVDAVQAEIRFINAVRQSGRRRHDWLHDHRLAIFKTGDRSIDAQVGHSNTHY